MTARPNLLQRFRCVLEWISRGMLGVLFVALVWFLEDRYALISGTDVRIKVTRLAEETRADGKTILVVGFDIYTLERRVTERLWLSHFPHPHIDVSGRFPEWSSQPVADAFQHVLRPRYSGLMTEIPIEGPLTSRFLRGPGDVIRLKRGDRVMFAKYKLPPSCDPTDGRDREFEVSYEIE